MKIAKTSDVIGIINKIAPIALAEQWDNPGLQVGSPDSVITRIMVSLDATPATIAASIDGSCQMLVTHHPLLFKPVSSITTATPLGKMLHQAVRSGLSIASLHTNYDCAENGLNDVLCSTLGIMDAKPLKITGSDELVKLVVFVPPTHLEKLRDALFLWTENSLRYRDCSFSAPGEGTFTPLDGSSPFIGTQGRLEKVLEHRLEVLIQRPLLPRVIKKLIAAHPYEEPAFDIIPLINQGRQYGLGRIGRVQQQMTLKEFAEFTGKRLDTCTLRYAGDGSRPVRTVAVCGGSGSSLLREALGSGADVLVTGDVTYHTARDAEQLGIGLVDAGHFATETIMRHAVAERIRIELNNSGFSDCLVEVCNCESDPFKRV